MEYIYTLYYLEQVDVTNFLTYNFANTVICDFSYFIFTIGFLQLAKVFKNILEKTTGIESAKSSSRSFNRQVRVCHDNLLLLVAF